jgi:hypothetical protein
MNQTKMPDATNPARLKTLKKRVRRNAFIIIAAIGVFAFCLNEYENLNAWGDKVGSNMHFVGLTKGSK